MRKVLLLLLAFLSVTGIAQADTNYPPDNKNVRLTSTNLPIVWMTVNGATIDRYDRITARMKIIHNGNGQLNYADTIAHPGQKVNYEGYVALRYRGNSTFSGSDKKPYSFRPLDKPLEDGGSKKKVDILGMGKDNNWALLAPYSDKSMMRDMLAFEISRPWMEYTPQGRYCELFLDGTYYGVYILSEVVSKGKKRLNLDDPTEEGDGLTGGYIVEVDRDEWGCYISKYHPVNNVGSPYSYQYIHFQFKSPDVDEITSTQMDYITARIDQMEDSLWKYSLGREPTYRELLDEQNFIDYQLAMELGHNVDGYRLSGKFFKRRDSVDPRFKMVLWDMNLAYGNSDYYNGWKTNTWMYKNNPTLDQYGDPQLIPFWWYKLNKNPEYTAALKSRWAQYRRSNLREDRLMAVIDSLANVLTINGAESRNSQAWPRWGWYVWPNYYVADNYADEVAWLKDWLLERIAWMDTQLGYDPNEFMRGDVNGDGEVNISDVAVLIDYLLTEVEPDGGREAADCDQNGQVSIADLSLLIDYLLAGQWRSLP